MWKLELERINISEKFLLLDGHFCLIDKNKNVVPLAFKTFEDTQMSKIILMKRDPHKIRESLLKRDNHVYSVEFLKKLQEREEIQAIKYAEEKAIKLFNYNEETVLSTLIDFIIN